jgi:hypothetical protein
MATGASGQLALAPNDESAPLTFPKCLLGAESKIDSKHEANLPWRCVA